MSAEDIVKWLLGLFAALVTGGLWLLVNAVRETRRTNSTNTKELYGEIAGVAREMRERYVRNSEFIGAIADVKTMIRDQTDAQRATNDKLDALVRELIEQRLDNPGRGKG